MITLLGPCMWCQFRVTLALGGTRMMLISQFQGFSQGVQGLQPITSQHFNSVISELGSNIAQS